MAVGSSVRPRSLAVPVRLRLLLGASTLCFVTACRAAPDPLPPWPVGDEPLIGGAWRPADPGPGGCSAELPPTVPAETAPLDAGRWAAQVEPADAERLPDVTVTLGQRLAEGMVAGRAAYDYGGYACSYALHVEAVAGRTVELRQRPETGPCGTAGRILLSRDEQGDLVGDWRRPGGSRWFRVRLTRIETEGGG